MASVLDLPPHHRGCPQRLRRRAGQVRGARHDYRSDLAAFTAIAFDLPADPALMRRVEAVSAGTRIAVGGAAGRCRTVRAGPRRSISRQMKSWSAVDTQVAAEVG